MIFAPFSIKTSQGLLWFIHDERPEMEPFMNLVKARCLAEVSQSQVECVCTTGLKIPVIGDVPNMRFGVFTEEEPSEKAFFGIWYFGRIFLSSPEEISNTRFMGGFPQLSTEDIGPLVAEIVHGLVDQKLPLADGGAVVIRELVYTFFDADRNDVDRRARSQVEAIAARCDDPKLSVKQDTATVDVGKMEGKISTLATEEKAVIDLAIEPLK